MELFELSCLNCGAPLLDDLRCEICGSRFILNGEGETRLTERDISLDDRIAFLGVGDGIVGPKTASRIKCYTRILED